MGDVVFLDPRLSRLGLRAPRELDGRRVLGVLEVKPWPCGSKAVDVKFAVEGSSPLWASTEKGSREWKTIVESR